MKSKSHTIIFEDNDILVVDKSPGVYSIKPRHETKDPVLLNELTEIFGDLYLLHRLDRDTSGIIIFARNEKSQQFISEQFTDNRLEKTYYAFIEGNISADDALLIDVPIFIDPGKYKVRIDKKGKPSQTKIRVIESYAGFSMIEAKLLTGRTHQIRIHLQYIGNPLIVDNLYGNRTEFFLSEIKYKMNLKNTENERPLVERQTLHAHNIKFIHPSTNEKIEFDCELPKDLRALRNQLGKFLR